MKAKVSVNLSVQRLEIKFNRRSDPENKYEDVAKWQSIKSDVAVSVVENKTAVAYVANPISRVDFELPYDMTLTSWTEEKGDSIYSMVSSNFWDEWDIREMVSGLEFDETELWFHIVPMSHGNVEDRLHVVDPDFFYDSLDDQTSEFECFGISDFFEDRLLWRNPSWNFVPNVLSVLKESCSSLQVDCVIFDELTSNVDDQTSQGWSCILL